VELLSAATSAAMPPFVLHIDSGRRFGAPAPPVGRLGARKGAAAAAAAAGAAAAANFCSSVDEPASAADSDRSKCCLQRADDFKIWLSMKHNASILFRTVSRFHVKCDGFSFSCSWFFCSFLVRRVPVQLHVINKRETHTTRIMFWTSIRLNLAAAFQQKNVHIVQQHSWKNTTGKNTWREDKYQHNNPKKTLLKML